MRKYARSRFDRMKEDLLKIGCRERAFQQRLRRPLATRWARSGIGEPLGADHSVGIDEIPTQ